MSRYKDEQCRICRREGQKLFLKGSRCYSDKCSITRRNYAPGQNGQKKSKISEYGTQLREKQKTKAFYGVGEKQFRKYFEMASNSRGKTGEVLLQILESRLDNIVYRIGFAPTRRAARQLVNHGHITVNGKKVDIPSYRVKIGDVVSLKEDDKNLKVVNESLEKVTKRVDFISYDENKKEATYLRRPERSELNADINEALIVEYYSRV